VLGSNYKIVELTEVTDSTIYKKYADSNGERVRQIGIRLKLQKGKIINLVVFEGLEGTIIGDEHLIVQRWISKIQAAHKKLSTAVIV
jgi:hypothetical protein